MITFSKLGNFGRLGNQLFQIAATISHAARCNVEFKFPAWKYSDYFKNKIPQGDIKIYHTYQEGAFGYRPIPVTKSLDLVGYFQSHKYFDPELLDHYFQPTDSVMDWVYKNRPDGELTGVHIRRGDYLSLPEYHFNLGRDYYESALQILGSHSKGKIIVFSDDIPWCKNNFKADFYSFGNEIEDLFLMASCDNIVMANSSFSWWSAYFSKANVISPKFWFGEKKKHDTKDLYLPSWNII